MNSWIVLAINLVVVGLAFVALRRYVDRQTRHLAVLDELKREVGSIVTELNQTTERNIQLVEDRIVRLTDLLAAADRKLGALKRQERMDAQTEVTYGRLKPAVTLSQQPPSDGDDPRPEQEHAPVGPAEEPEIPLRERVRNLYLRGLPLERIASLTGRTVGEIELIISLDEE